MMDKKVRIELLNDKHREGFIRDLQWAFKHGATEEFGLRDNHFEEEDEIISRETIENSLDSGTAYSIFYGNKVVGGAVVRVAGTRGELELLFVIPDEHSKGIGQTAWYLIEKSYPRVKKWETVTPYFERRNIHFYINKCGFKAVEFLCEFHGCIDTNAHSLPADAKDDADSGGMFRFVKEVF